MKNKQSLTYQEYLAIVAGQPQNGGYDYGMHLQDQTFMHSLAGPSSPLVFLLDYSSKNYPVMGKNARSIMGYPQEAFYEGGLEFMLHQYQDFETLNKKMFPDELKLISLTCPEALARLRFSRSYRYKDWLGNDRTILQRHSAIYKIGQKLPVAIFGFAHDITGYSEKGKVIHQIEEYNAENGEWKLLLSKEYYPDIEPNTLLSKREIEILKWSIEGLGSKQIADKLFISFNTVNTHRRNMLRKTNSQNSLELLHYALENKLL